MTCSKYATGNTGKHSATFIIRVYTSCTTYFEKWRNENKKPYVSFTRIIRNWSLPVQIIQSEITFSRVPGVDSASDHLSCQPPSPSSSSSGLLQHPEGDLCRTMNFLLRAKEASSRIVLNIQCGHWSIDMPRFAPNLFCRRFKFLIKTLTFMSPSNSRLLQSAQNFATGSKLNTLIWFGKILLSTANLRKRKPNGFWYVVRT